MDWCKLWAEWGTDPKVQSMTESMRCRHVLLMCLRCTHETSALTEDEIAFYMRITADELAQTKSLFVTKGFIDKRWNVLKWEKRQDSVSPAAQRMRALRERERNELRNSDVTDDVTDSGDVAQLAGASEEKTREEKTREDKKNAPRNAVFVLPDWIPLETWTEFLLVRKRKKAAITPYAHRLVIKTLVQLKAEGHDPIAVINQSIRSGWADVFPLRDSQASHKNGKRHEVYDPTPEQISAMNAMCPEIALEADE